MKNKLFILILTICQISYGKCPDINGLFVDCHNRYKTLRVAKEGVFQEITSKDKIDQGLAKKEYTIGADHTTDLYFYFPEVYYKTAAPFFADGIVQPMPAFQDFRARCSQESLFLEVANNLEFMGVPDGWEIPYKASYTLTNSGNILFRAKRSDELETETLLCKWKGSN